MKNILVSYFEENSNLGKEMKESQSFIKDKSAEIEILDIIQVLTKGYGRFNNHLVFKRYYECFFRTINLLTLNSGKSVISLYIII